MISICITIKNRSLVKVAGGDLLLFPKCVQSIVEAVPADIPCELIVTDWGSSDWPLAQWLQQAAQPIPVQIISITGGFSRGQGLNIAAKAAKGDCLFFTDADCLLCAEVLRSGIKYLQENKAYFPVLYSFDGPEHKNGWWRHEGFGNCMVTKAMFELADGWPEYDVWGKEDDHFHSKIAAQVKVVREEVRGFCHQWHPNDIVWKNQHSTRAAEITQEIEQVKIATQELIVISPQGGTIILVDETRFGNDCIPSRQTVPFTEWNGEYGGPPADDEAAIREFERRRQSGANFIAIAWPAFWWLEYYKDWHQYLRSNFSCVLENERLVVFDLGQQNY